MSHPVLSKSTTFLSFFQSASSFSRVARRRFSMAASPLTVRREPLSLFSAAMAAEISAIWALIDAFRRS